MEHNFSNHTNPSIRLSMQYQQFPPTNQTPPTILPNTSNYGGNPVMSLQRNFQQQQAFQPSFTHQPAGFTHQPVPLFFQPQYQQAVLNTNLSQKTNFYNATSGVAVQQQMVHTDNSQQGMVQYAQQFVLANATSVGPPPPTNATVLVPFNASGFSPATNFQMTSSAYDNQSYTNYSRPPSGQQNGKKYYPHNQNHTYKSTSGRQSQLSSTSSSAGLKSGKQSETPESIMGDGRTSITSQQKSLQLVNSDNCLVGKEGDVQNDNSNECMESQQIAPENGENQQMTNSMTTGISEECLKIDTSVEEYTQEPWYEEFKKLKEVDFKPKCNHCDLAHGILSCGTDYDKRTEFDKFAQYAYCSWKNPEVFQKPVRNHSFYSQYNVNQRGRSKP